MNDNRKSLYIFSTNSIILYILSFLVVYIPSQFATYLVANYFKIPTRFNYFKIIFPIEDHNYLWTQKSVVYVYSAAPITALVAGIIFLRVYISLVSYNKPLTNLFLIWGYIHSVNLILGGLVVGIPIIEGVGYIPSWLYATPVISAIILLSSIILLLANGFFLRKAIVCLSFSEEFLNKPYNSLQFKIAIMYLPYIVATILFIIFNFPGKTLYDRTLNIIIIIQLIGIFPFSYIHYEIKDSDKKVTFSLKALFYLIILFTAFIIWKYIHNL